MNEPHPYIRDSTIFLSSTSKISENDVSTEIHDFEEREEHNVKSKTSLRVLRICVEWMVQEVSSACSEEDPKYEPNLPIMSGINEYSGNRHGCIGEAMNEDAFILSF